MFASVPNLLHSRLEIACLGLRLWMRSVGLCVWTHCVDVPVCVGTHCVDVAMCERIVSMWLCVCIVSMWVCVCVCVSAGIVSMCLPLPVLRLIVSRLETMFMFHHQLLLHFLSLMWHCSSSSSSSSSQSMAALYTISHLWRCCRRCVDVCVFFVSLFSSSMSVCCVVMMVGLPRVGICSWASPWRPVTCAPCINPGKRSSTSSMSLWKSSGNR